MFEVALFGAGKIGEAITALLCSSGRYRVRVCDLDGARAKELASWFPSQCTAVTLDLNDHAKTCDAIRGTEAVLSALPFFCNEQVADAAKATNVHYFDLTEDVRTTQHIKQLSVSASSVFMPQCGLAPGFIGLAAHSLCKKFEKLSSVKLRTGALPCFPSNRLKYNLTWSTDGLINEYINPCEVIEDGRRHLVPALEGYERLTLQGTEYEAFNTSGGCGALAHSLEGKVSSLSYKTMRYPGHRDLILFLLDDLGLRNDRATLKSLFEKNIPGTKQDKCVVFVEITGERDGKLLQEAYASSVLGDTVAGHAFTAIQVTTASGICTPLDLLLTGALKVSSGFVPVEEISLDIFLANEFGRFYRPQ